MVKVTWTERTAMYEERWIDVPDSDIEQLLEENPDYDEDDVKNWIKRNRWNYDVQYGDTDYDDDGESIDIEVDADNELDGIIEDFKEKHKDDEEDEEETDNTFIGTLGYDED